MCGGLHVPLAGRDSRGEGRRAAEPPLHPGHELRGEPYVRQRLGRNQTLKGRPRHHDVGAVARRLPGLAATLGYEVEVLQYQTGAHPAGEAHRQRGSVMAPEYAGERVRTARLETGLKMHLGRYGVDISGTVLVEPLEERS